MDKSYGYVYAAVTSIMIMCVGLAISFFGLLSGTQVNVILSGILGMTVGIGISLPVRYYGNKHFSNQEKPEVK